MGETADNNYLMNTSQICYDNKPVPSVYLMRSVSLPFGMPLRVRTVLSFPILFIVLWRGSS